MKYNNVSYLCGEIDNELSYKLLRLLNDGYEVIHINSQHVPKGNEVSVVHTPCLIAILGKRTGDSDEHIRQCYCHECDECLDRLDF